MGLGCEKLIERGENSVNSTLKFQLPPSLLLIDEQPPKQVYILYTHVSEGP